MKPFLLICLCLFSPVMLAAPSKQGGKYLLLNVADDEVYEFARALEIQGDYYRAITEYKRVVFQESSLERKRGAWLGIARCYFVGKKWSALEKACQKALKLEGWAEREALELTAARSLALWNLDRAFEARELLKTVSDKTLTEEETALLAWLNVASGNISEARDLFSTTQLSQETYVLSHESPRTKSPYIAAGLSAVIPGAGQLYAGKPESALGAFLVNGLILAATIESFDEDLDALGWGLGIVGFGFWTGNVYGAANFVISENKEKMSHKDDWLAKRLGYNKNYKENFGWRFTHSF